MHERLVAIVILGSVVITGGAATAQTSDPAIHFADTSEVQLGSQPVPVTLVNDSAATWRLSVTAHVVPADDPSKVVPVDVGDAPKRIAPAGMVVIVLGPAGAEVVQASGSVVVVARRPGEVVVARRPIVIGPATPAPAVTKWVGVAIRPAPWGDGSTDGLPDIPIAGETCGSITTGTVSVTTGSDHVAFDYLCADDGGAPSLSLASTGERPIGEYTGTLSVGGKDVPLTFRETTWWPWAVIILILGFALATAQQAWVNNRRPVKRASARLTEIKEDADAKQRVFKEAANGHRYQLYDLTPSVTLEVTRLQAKLDAVLPSWGRGWFLPVPVEEQKAAYDLVVKAMTELNDAVTRWPAMADDLDKARMVYDRVVGDGSAALAPGLVAAVSRLIEPGVVADAPLPADADNMRKLLEEARKATGVLDLLPLAVLLGEALESVTPEAGTETDKGAYGRAMLLYRQAIAELALASDILGVGKAKVADLLAEVRALVLQLTGDPALVTEALAPKDEVPVGIPMGFVPRTLRALTTTGQVRATDFTWLLVAIAIGAWTGLQALYFNKAWGTPIDYVTLLLWAFGSATVITPILSGFERVAAGVLPLKKADGADEAKPRP